MEPVRAAGSRPFIGREQERALLRHLLREAGTGRPAVVVVTGMPGAGKSALLRWAGDAAAAAGAFVLRTSGSEGTVPFDALRRLVAPVPELSLLLDRDAAGETAAVRGDHAVRLGTEVAEALAAHARRRLLAVVVDDAHDLERASGSVLAAALASLDDAAARTSLRLIVFVAAREPVAEGSLAARALRLDAARALALGGFDAQDISDLLASSGQRASPARVRQLLDDTGGLPLLVESIIERRARPPGAGGVAATPERVRSIADALRERFRDLDAPALDMLRLAALLGEPWEPADLAVAGGFDHAAVLDAVAAAGDAQVVRAGPQGWRFAHPLVRTELLDGVNDRTRRALHRTIADRLAATAGADGTLDDALLVRVADHVLRSRPPPGEPEPPGDGTAGVGAVAVADVARRAGAVTERWGAWHETARFLAAAAEGATGREAGALWFDAGSAAYLDHDPERAEDLLGRAIDEAGRAGDAATVLRAAMFLARRRAGARFRLGARVDLAELEAALADADAGDVDVDPALVVEAEAALAEALIVSGESDWALEVTERARVRAAAARGAPRLDGPLGRVDFAEGIHRLRRLEMPAADGCFRAGARRAVAAGDPLTAVYNRSRRALGTLMRGEVGDARAQALAVEDEALACGYPGEAGFAAAQLATGYTLGGAAALTSETVERAYRQWRATDFTYIAALLAPVVAATDAATQGVVRDLGGSAAGPGLADLPAPAAVGVLAAVEAADAEGVRARVRAARWRHGFRGRVTQARDGVAVALVEAGDLLGDSDLVASAGAAVDTLLDRGVLVTTGWPTTTPRVGAVVARHAGDAARGERLVEQALALCEREGLAAERPKALLELGRCAAAGGSPTGDVAALFAEAVRGFDALSMHGWVARADAIAQSLGFAVLAAHGPARARAIYTDDVVGSTESNSRLGDAVYLEQLRIHDRIVRARLAEFGGREIKHTGDGINAVFDDRIDAARCALAVQRDIDAWRRSEPDLALQIRSGLAHGPVIPSGGDFFGLVQSQAARLCSLAGPGEVLATAEIVTALPDGTALVKSLGHRDLKGLRAPIEVFRLDDS